ncbi:histidine phosphatase family protein [Xanthobacter sp. V4C-4]|uniref:histidine phosphatase family protein n=1 Tax=Xanthobacter cornucopiae TaxID=3119924 RepID=UPI00372A41E1
MAGRGVMLAGGACALAMVLAASEAVALPGRIILLRHGEKQDAYRLCPVGLSRAQGLAAQHLGRDASASLFRPGETPKGFFAITLHTLETIAPSAASWGQPVITYAALPDASGALADTLLNAQTQQLARDLLTDPRWDGATVVVTWEHDHIAKTVSGHAGKDAAEKAEAAAREASRSPQKLEAAVVKADGRPEAPSTLFDLFGLARFAEALSNWPGETYDYFWIIDFDPNTREASSFQKVRQVYSGPYAALPQNEWGQPDGLTAASGCQL